MIFEKIDLIKRELSSIHKNTQGYGYTYPNLSLIKEHLDPLLEKHKLSMTITNVKLIAEKVYEFVVHFTDLEFTDDRATFTFVTNEDSMQSNNVQKTGSTYSYMQRYIKKIIFDLDFVDDDPDNIKNSKLIEKKKPALDNSGKEIVIKLMKEKGLKGNDIINIIKDITDNKSTTVKELNKEQLKELINRIEKWQGK